MLTFETDMFAAELKASAGRSAFEASQWQNQLARQTQIATEWPELAQFERAREKLSPNRPPAADCAIGERATNSHTELATGSSGGRRSRTTPSGGLDFTLARRRVERDDREVSWQPDDRRGIRPINSARASQWR